MHKNKKRNNNIKICKKHKAKNKSSLKNIVQKKIIIQYNNN